MTGLSVYVDDARVLRVWDVARLLGVVGGRHQQRMDTQGRQVPDTQRNTASEAATQGQTVW